MEMVIGRNVNGLHGMGESGNVKSHSRSSLHDSKTVGSPVDVCAPAKWSFRPSLN